VIAAGKNVGAIPEQIVGKLRSNPKAARGVFAVGDGEMDVLGSYDLGQVLSHHSPPDGGKNIADKKEIGQMVVEVKKERTTVAVTTSVI
jgi:hypothetical protein